MDWLVTIRLMAFTAFGLFLPQALGLAGYRWTRRKTALRKASSVLIPPFVFFVTAYSFWEFEARTIRNAGLHVCGAFGAAVTFSTVFGTFVHWVAGAIVFAALSLWWKRQDRKGFLPRAAENTLGGSSVNRFTED